MESKFKYIVKAEDSGKELKAIVKNEFAFSSRLLTKLKNENLIFLNGESMPGWIQVNEGDVVSVMLPEETSDFEPEDIPIEVVFEDDDILVINKQPGHVVHPTKGKPYHTIANGIQKKMEDDGVNYKIRFVNRLDMNTSGLLIIAKNSFSQDILEKEMGKDHMNKKYLALCEGIFENKEGTIDKPLGRPDPNEVERWILNEQHGGFRSVTHYKVVEEYPGDYIEHGDRIDGFSLVELVLETGRTHQIRVHLASIGHPVAGDHLYCHGDPFEYRRIYGDKRPPLDGTPGPRDTNPEVVSNVISRQALHAYSLEFKHPVTGEKLKLEAKLPNDMLEAIDRIKKQKNNKIEKIK